MPEPPHKWSEYTAMKDVVDGTRFIPFKTPYKEIVRGERFSPDVLMRRIGNLGFVLNLVKTDRYYNPAAYIRRNIQTCHVRLEGHAKLPTAGEIDKIFNTLKQYMKFAEDQTMLIGVHCTHGVNRTGYIICRYMIEQLGIKPEEAIDRFQKARGHEFDHEEYVDDLLKLTPSVDHESLAWHSIGGKVIPQKLQGLEADVDVEAFMKKRNRRKQQPAARSEDGADRQHSRSSEEHNDRHHRRDSNHRRGRDSERYNTEHKLRKKRLRDERRRKARQERRAGRRADMKVTEANQPCSSNTRQNDADAMDSPRYGPKGDMSALPNPDQSPSEAFSAPSKEEGAEQKRAPNGEGTLGDADGANLMQDRGWWTGQLDVVSSMQNHNATQIPSFGKFL